jgi:hypothetical protein
MLMLNVIFGPTAKAKQEAPLARYYWSYDNPRNGDYRKARRLLGAVAEVEVTPPKTTFRLDRRKGLDFSALKAALKRTLDPRRGRGVLFSTKTGRVFVIDNRGNHRGLLLRQA